MNDRTRGELNIDEQGKKPSSDNPDYSDFKPRSQPPKPSTEPSERTAEESGFTTRHAPPAPAKVDGRSLRSSNRTTQLDIAVRNKGTVLETCPGCRLQTGEDFLNRLMDGFSRGG